MKTPSLDLLRTFLAVHRTGSITAAADLLGLAQPTVTAQVRSLEQLLGRPLFDRLPRGVAPTAAADALARRIAEPLDQIDLVMAEETTDGFLGTVYLGGPAEILTARVLPTLAPLVAEGLRVSVQFGLPDPLLDQLISGRLDLLVVSVRPRRRGLWVEPLYDEEFALVAAPTWAQRIDSPVTPRSLADVPLVAYAEEAPILRRYWRTVFGTRLTRSPDLVVPDLRAVHTAVVAGAGASVLPTYLCRETLADGDLQDLVEPEMPPLNTLFLVARQGVADRREIAAVRTTLIAAARTW